MVNEYSLATMDEDQHYCVVGVVVVVKVILVRVSGIESGWNVLGLFMRVIKIKGERLIYRGWTSRVL